jgi:hypothetical protein
MCDSCSSGISGSEGYAVYSEVPMVPGVPIGNMLICETCAQRIFSDQSFAAPRKHTGAIALTGDRTLLRELNDEFVIARCKKLGLSPQQAREEARRLALEFHKDNQRGATLNYQFWTSVSPKPAVTRPTASSSPSISAKSELPKASGSVSAPATATAGSGHKTPTVTAGTAKKWWQIWK